MRGVILLIVLGWPASGLAAAPEARLKPGGPLTVARGKAIILDAGESLDADKLVWMSSSDVSKLPGVTRRRPR